MNRLISEEIDYGAIPDEEIVKTLKAFKYRRFNAYFAKDAETARRIVLELIPNEEKVGFGDSTTLNQLGIPQALIDRGTTVYRGHAKGITQEEAAEMNELAYSKECKYFMAGTNAVTLDGRLINVDMVGNRVAGMFCHDNSILVVGRNKITKDLNDAFNRVRHQISPQHAKIRSTDLGSRPLKSGCINTGICVDCQGEDRLCNVFSIIEGKPRRTNIHIILVNLDLGLGWDESWPAKRIQNIIDDYKRNVWIPQRS